MNNQLGRGPCEIYEPQLSLILVSVLWDSAKSCCKTEIINCFLNVLLVYRSVYHVCLVIVEDKEQIRYLGTAFSDDHKPPDVCKESKLIPLDKHTVHVIAE